MNYLNIDHDSMIARLNADEFVAYMPIRGHVMAVYHSSKPDKSKGHVEYPAVFKYDGSLRITAAGDIEAVKTINASRCNDCNKVIYSMYRHDYVICGCPSNVMVDGGTDYFKYGGKEGSYTLGTYDLLKKEFTLASQV